MPRCAPITGKPTCCPSMLSLDGIKAVFTATALCLTATTVQSDSLTAGLIASVSEDGYIAEAIAVTGPAEQAGLKPGDRFIQLYDIPVESLSADMIDQAFRAALTGHRHDVPVSVRREDGREAASVISPVIDDEYIDYNVFDVGSDGDVAVVRINSFDVFVPAHLHKFLRATYADALVIDLRGNTGGLVESAVAAADLFLAEKSLIAREEINGVSQDHIARKALIFPGPVVIVQDGDTASAAELFTLALTQNNRAITVGWKSYGKSRVDVVRVNDTVPIGSYEGPRGAKVPKNGLPPFFDIGGKDPRAIGRRGSADPARDVARELAKAALAEHRG